MMVRALQVCFLCRDDFVDISDSSENLQKLIDVVHKVCNWWRLKANVSKCAVVVFQRVKYLVAGHGVSIPFHKHQVIVIKELPFHLMGAGWDIDVKRVISNERKNVNQLHSILSNRNINLIKCPKTFASFSPST